MNDSIISAGAQQPDEPVSNNWQPSDDDSFAPIYGGFDSATGFLDSLEGRLAAERDELRLDDQADEVVADKILGLQAEAASLTFTAVPAGSTGVMSVTAWITTDTGEEAIDVCKLDPADVAKRIGFAQRLSAVHPAIKAVGAERKLMQLDIVAGCFSPPALSPSRCEFGFGPVF